MNLSFYKFGDKEEFLQYLAKTNMILCKRNYISRYNSIYGLLDENHHLAAACIIDDSNIKRPFIKLFEVSPEYSRKGIGTRLFNDIKDWYKDFNYFTTFELESLDDESDAFWKSLGFTEYTDEDGDIRMKKVIC